MNKRIFWLVIILFILVGLNLSMYANDKTLDCQKCVVTFKQTAYSGIQLDEPRIYRYKAIELYNSLIKGECLIKWDRSQGYYFS